MLRKKNGRGETNAREETPVEAPDAQIERDFRQQELRDEIDAIKDPSKLIDMCLAALAGDPMPLEREFWYAYNATFYLSRMRRSEEAEQLALRCSEIAVILNSNHLKTRAIYLEADIHNEKREFLTSLQKIRESAKLLKLSQNTVLDEPFALRLDVVEAGLLQRMGRYNEAIAMSLQALPRAEKLNKDMFMVLTGNIGLLLYHIKAYDEAMPYLLETVSLSSELGKQYGVAGGLCNVGNAYTKKGEYTNAKRYHLQALDAIRSTPLRTTMETDFHVYILIALVEDCDKLETIDEGIGYATEAIAVAEQVKADHLIANVHLHFCKILLHNQRYEEALSHGQKANEFRGEWTDEDDKELASALSKIYAALGEFSVAFEFEKKARELGEGYAKAKMDGQLEYQKYLQKESAEKTAEILRLKEQELANSSIHLATQTEMLGNFRNEMRAIVREINEPISALKKIKEKLKELPCESVDWVKFEKEFTAVHPEFRAKLAEKYPELTKQEIKMCQLARLGLKTYEMSRLLCLSERTIDGHRNGLRKKLGIKPQDNLKDFLQSIR